MDFIACIENITKYQQELVKAFRREFCLSHMKNVYMTPVSGSIKAESGEWEFIREENGVMFTHVEKGIVVDVSNDFDENSRCFNDMTLLRYCESQGISALCHDGVCCPLRYEEFHSILEEFVKKGVFARSGARYCLALVQDDDDLLRNAGMSGKESTVHGIEAIGYQELMEKWAALDIYETREYSEPWGISLANASAIHIRLPEKMRLWRRVISDVLRTVNQDSTMYVWRRKMLNPPHRDSDWEKGLFPFFLEQLSGISEKGGGYCFLWQKFDVLCELCLAHVSAANATYHDLFIVPEDGKGVVWLCHHDELHVYGKDEVLSALVQKYPDAVLRDRSSRTKVSDKL